MILLLNYKKKKKIVDKLVKQHRIIPHSIFANLTFLFQCIKKDTDFHYYRRILTVIRVKKKKIIILYHSMWHHICTQMHNPVQFRKRDRDKW